MKVAFRTDSFSPPSTDEGFKCLNTPVTGTSSPECNHNGVCEFPSKKCACNGGFAGPACTGKHYNLCLSSMAKPVVEFSRKGYKIRKVFASESTCPKEIIES